MLHWIHPTVVHFPIALLFAALLFDLLGLLRTNEKLLFAGFWSGLLGAFSVLVAIGTGLYAASVLGPHNETGNAILGFHRTFAFVVGATVVGLVAWRLTMRGYIRPRSRTLYLSASLFCAVMVFITGAMGGWLVYMSGLGIAPETARRVLEAQPGQDNPHYVPKSLLAKPIATDAGAPGSAPQSDGN